MAKLSKSALQKKLKKIRLLLLDIDGVLTDGKILYVEGTGWTCFYSVLDGYGVKLLQRAGIEVGVVSGGSFTSHRKRAEVLQMKYIYLGNESKTEAFEEILRKSGFKEEEIAFVGDELFDMPLLRRVGLAMTVPHAPPQLTKLAHYVTKAHGGNGAVREVADMLLRAQKKMPEL